MAAFEEADPNNIAKRIVDHIINTKSRTENFIKQTKDFLPDQDWDGSVETGQWGETTKNGFDKNPPKLYIIKRKNGIKVPKDMEKNWAQLFITEGALGTASVWVHGHIEEVYSTGYYRDKSQKKREKKVENLKLKKEVENAKIKIFETCVILAEKDAPEGLKNVMVFAKGSHEPSSLGDALNHNDTLDKKENSVLGRILREIDKIIVTSDAVKRALKLRKQQLAKEAREAEECECNKPEPPANMVSAYDKSDDYYYYDNDNEYNNNYYDNNDNYYGNNYNDNDYYDNGGDDDDY